MVHAWPGSEIDWLYHPDGSEMADFMPTPWNDWGNTYFNLNGSPIAKYIGGVADGELYFFHSNAIGSTSFITSYHGDVVQKELFYPYGQTQASGDLGIGSYRFAKLRELLPYGETGTFMSQSRDYPSSLYRWFTPDQYGGGPVVAYGPPDPTPPGALPYADILNPQSLNKYQYAYNNPLRYIDPSGHLCFAVLWGGTCSPDPPPPSATPQQQQDSRGRKRPIVIVTTDTTHPSPFVPGVVQRNITYAAATRKGDGFQADKSGKKRVSMKEVQTGGNDKPTLADPNVVEARLEDEIRVTGPGYNFTTTQTLFVDGKQAEIHAFDKGANKVVSGDHAYVEATANEIKVKYGP